MGSQVVERTFAVLDALSATDGEIRLGELAVRTTLPKSTLSRILATLTDLDVVARGAADGSYRLGPRARLLAGPGSFEEVLVRAARPELRRLVADLDEDLGLGVPDGHHVRYVDQVRSHRPVRIRDYVGERMPAHTTAAGLIMLADLDEEEFAAYLSHPLDAYGPGTPIDAQALGAAVDEVRNTGRAWTFEAWADGINGAAVGIRSDVGQLLAVINVFGPSYRFPGDRDRGQLGERLVAAADEITHRQTT